MTPADATAKEQPVESFDYRQNPFTLVYGGALTKNERGKVNIHPVSYQLSGLDIAANVYTPPNYDAKATYAAIAVAHPNGGVKEQTAGLYAQRPRKATSPSQPTRPIKAPVAANRAASTNPRIVPRTFTGWRISFRNILASTQRAWACWASAVAAATR